MAQAGDSEKGLKRTLGAGNLVALGIGAIIGAGLFVRTAAAAGQQLQQTYRDATLQIQGRPQDIATSSAPDPDVQELNITQIRQ